MGHIKNKFSQGNTKLISVILCRRRTKASLKRHSIMLMSILLTSFLMLTLSGSGEAYADYTISMTSSGAQSIDVSPSGNSGGSAGSNDNGTAISTDSITVNTNCRAGYNLNIATSVSDNNLYLGGDSTNNATGTYFTPADGTTTLGSSVNKWGYYYNSAAPTTSPTKSNVFMAVPVSGSPATVISPTASATDISDSFNIYYGVSVSNTLAIGTYKMIPDTNTDDGNGGHYNGSIVYYLTVAEACMPYTVTFNPTSTAGGNTLSGTGTMSPQTIPAGVATALNSNTFTAPAGYEFDSWNTAQDGTGTSYTDGQSVTDLTTGGGNITLYAQWKKELTMQTATMADCGKTLKDSRDGNTYTTALLADGKCWMVENLNLAGGTALSADDTDVTSAYISSFTTGNNLTKTGDTIVLPASSTSGFKSTNYSYVYNSTSTDCSSATGCSGYYSWDAATLGSGRSISTDNTDAPYSICPKGWKLPTTYNGTNSTTDFRALMIAYGGSDSVQTYNSSTSPTGATMYGSIGPNTTPNFLLAGLYNNGSFYFGGSDGYYWSATSHSNSSGTRILYFNSSYVYSASNNLRNYGFSVRCVKASDGYMQGFALTDAEDGAEYTLMDKRDNNTYTVKKINGELWMTQNLRYLGDTGSAAGTMTIGNNNGNVANKDITLYSLNLSNAGNFGAYSGHCDSTNGYNYACVYDSGSTSTGVWYNYVAASAGTISANSNSTAATSDICPAGWHLPSGPNTTANSDLNKLVGNTTSGYQAATSGLTAFSAVAVGYYSNGSLRNTEYGYWWSATAVDTTPRYLLLYNSSKGQFYGDGSLNRYFGVFVRCVRSS